MLTKCKGSSETTGHSISMQIDRMPKQLYFKRPVIKIALFSFFFVCERPWRASRQLVRRSFAAPARVSVLRWDLIVRMWRDVDPCGPCDLCGRSICPVGYSFQLNPMTVQLPLVNPGLISSHCQRYVRRWQRRCDGKCIVTLPRERRLY